MMELLLYCEKEREREKLIRLGWRDCNSVGIRSQELMMVVGEKYISCRTISVCLFFFFFDKKDEHRNNPDHRIDTI